MSSRQILVKEPEIEQQKAKKKVRIQILVARLELSGK
jgi:hypothetical protein